MFILEPEIKNVHLLLDTVNLLFLDAIASLQDRAVGNSRNKLILKSTGTSLHNNIKY